MIALSSVGECVYHQRTVWPSLSLGNLLIGRRMDIRRSQIKRIEGEEMVMVEDWGC